MPPRNPRTPCYKNQSRRHPPRLLCVAPPSSIPDRATPRRRRPLPRPATPPSRPCLVLGTAPRTRRRRAWMPPSPATRRRATSPGHSDAGAPTTSRADAAPAVATTTVATTSPPRTCVTSPPTSPGAADPLFAEHLTAVTATRLAPASATLRSPCPDTELRPHRSRQRATRRRTSTSRLRRGRERALATASSTSVRELQRRPSPWQQRGSRDVAVLIKHRDPVRRSRPCPRLRVRTRSPSALQLSPLHAPLILDQHRRGAVLLQHHLVKRLCRR